MSGAVGEGFATVARDGAVLDAWFLDLKLASGGKAATHRLTETTVPGHSAEDLAHHARTDDIRQVEVVPVRTGWDIKMGLVIASGADAAEAIARCEQVLETVRWTTA